MQATTIEPVTGLASAAHAEGGVSGCARVRACVRARSFSLRPQSPGARQNPRLSRPPTTADSAASHPRQGPRLLPAPSFPHTGSPFPHGLPRAEAVRAEATGSSSALTVGVQRPGRAGAVRLRRSCGRGVGRGPVPEDGGGGGELGVSGQSSGELIWRGMARGRRWLSGRGAVDALTLQAGNTPSWCWGIQDPQVGPAGARGPRLTWREVSEI